MSTVMAEERSSGNAEEGQMDGIRCKPFSSRKRRSDPNSTNTKALEQSLRRLNLEKNTPPCESEGNSVNPSEIVPTGVGANDATSMKDKGGFVCQNELDIGLMTLADLQEYSLELTQQHKLLRARLEREQVREDKVLKIINSLAKRGHKHPYVCRINQSGEFQDIDTCTSENDDNKKKKTQDYATNCPENPPSPYILRGPAGVPRVQGPTRSRCSSPLYAAVCKRISESEGDKMPHNVRTPELATDSNQIVTVEAEMTRRVKEEAHQNQLQDTSIYGEYQYRFEVMIPATAHFFVPKRMVVMYFASNPICGAGLLIIQGQHGQPSKYYTFRQNHENLSGPIGFWSPSTQAELEIQTCFSGIEYFRNWLRVGDDVQVWSDSTALHWNHFAPFAVLRTNLATLQSIVGCRVRLFYDVPVQNIYLRLAHLFTTFEYRPFQESPSLMLKSLGIVPG